MNEFTFIVYNFNYLTLDDLWEWLDNQNVCVLIDIRMEPDEVIVTPMYPEIFDEHTLQELKDDFNLYFSIY